MNCFSNGAEQLLRRGDWPWLLLIIPPDPNTCFRKHVQLLEQHFAFRTPARIFEGVIHYMQKLDTLPVFEEWCTQANGKFLFGTDDLTLLDIHCGPMFEIMYLMTGPVYGDVDEHLSI